MPTISVTVSASDGQRVLDAYTRMFGRPATLSDVKAIIVARLKAEVKASETEALREALSTPAEISVT